MSLVDRTIAERTRELGRVVSPEHARATTELYAPLHSGTSDGVEIVRDQCYGPDDRHRLDLFLGAAARAAQTTAADVPVVVFVHGGNFVAGDKHVAGSPFYDNVGVWAARSGFLGVTLTYRLAPEHRFPAGRDDVASALDWILRRCGQWGGDPHAIVLIGASAGATHVAGVVADDGDNGQSTRVAGAALLSGMYDLGEFGNADVLTPYYGPDSAVWAAASPLAGVARSGVSMLLAIAEHEPPAQQRQLVLMANAILEETGALPRLSFLPAHNHFSQVLHIGTEDQLFTAELSSFIAACSGASQARRRTG